MAMMVQNAVWGTCSASLRKVCVSRSSVPMASGRPHMHRFMVSAASGAASDKDKPIGKVELANMLAERLNAKKGDTKEILDAFYELVVEKVAEGHKIAITNFGSFDTRAREARKGRNPSSGAEIDIPASKSPKFTPGKEFKDRVNGTHKPATPKPKVAKAASAARKPAAKPAANK